MASGTALRVWVGFAISLLCALFCGWLMSFNVYSVDLKEQFNLTQTQVEIAASGGVLGGSASVASAFVIHRYGFRASYLISASLLLTSGTLMWTATLHKPFFGQWIGFVSVFLMLGHAACFMGIQCCFIVGLQIFPSHHRGKIISCYSSILALGRIYYSGVYELFFQASKQLGLFFLLAPIPTAVTLLSCRFLHVPRNTQCAGSEHEGLLKSGNDVTEEKQGDVKSVGLQSSSHLPMTTVFRSGFAHLTVLSAALLLTTAGTFLNNVTSIAVSVGVPDPLSTGYVLSVGMILFHILSGLVYDRVSTNTGLAVFLFVCHFPVCSGMFIGLVWLGDVTIYVICALTSVGLGTIFILTVSLLHSVYGSKHLPVFDAYIQAMTCVLLVVSQLIVGVTFDSSLSDINSSNQQRNHGFFWAFFLLFCVSLTSLILQMANIIFYVKPKVPPTLLPWKLP